MSNHLQFYEFFNRCKKLGMGVRVNRGRIQARVAFETSSAMRKANVRLRMSIDAGDDEQVVMETFDGYTPEEVPGGYNARFGEWEYVDGDLVISGNHPWHGSYTTTFQFIGPYE